jgi:5-methylcytosine-specific restriction endonuclease McrA
MNRWNIPQQLEHEVLARDKSCVYCGIEFAPFAQTRGAKPSWEHIINDARIITRENIARCCMSCNASKGAKELTVWLRTKYCQRKGINISTVAEVVRNALSRKQI